MTSNEKIVVFGPALPLNLAPMWVAHDKGFFKEEGLDVDLRPVQGIPDSQHPRHQWRKDGAIIFQSPGGSPPFRSVLENRDHIDGEVNVVSIANRTAHVFVAKPYVKDVPDLKGKKIAGDLKGGSKRMLRGSIAAASRLTRNVSVWRCLKKAKSMRCAAIHRIGTSPCRWAVMRFSRAVISSPSPKRAFQHRPR